MVAPAPLALDASLEDEPTTGIGLYARELFRALQPLMPVERWGARKSGEVPRRGSHRSLWTVSELGRLLGERRPRAYHAVSNFNLPWQRVPGVPLVLTVHDLVPVLLPGTVSAAFRWQFRLWLARSLVVAEQVVCVSEVTRRSLVEHFGVAPDKLTVIHHGVDHVHRVAAPDPITLAWLDALGLSPDFLLYAGALDARKNVELVLGACERLFEGGTRPTLVLAGQRWFGSAAIEARVRRLRARGLDVRVLGYLEASVFYALMRRAAVFVFPSRYEGFGLPPLEAMALGVATVISTAGALPEVCGDGAAQVGPDDVEGLAATLARLLADVPARRALAQRGREVAQGYRWEATARQTVQVYDRL
jgi:glycosyltransferase involved in cell wall biosynthesis